MILQITLLAASLVSPAETKCDRWLVGLYGKLPFTEYTLVDRCARTLEGNTGGGSTRAQAWPWHSCRAARPSSMEFAGVWNWDCAFMALAMCKWDVELARDQFRIFMKTQRQNGQYIDCWTIKEGIFDGCTKPPVLGWAVWAAERTQHDERFLGDAYASLKLNMKWWDSSRRRSNDRLYHYDGNATDEKTRQLYAGWESGMDDSPRWDKKPWQIWPVDLNAYMVINLRALAFMADRLGLADECAEWHRRERDLAAAAEELLWNDQAGMYCDYDFVESRFVQVLTPAAFLPLYVGTASEEHAKKMFKVAERLSPGWPTVAYDEPTYNPVGYWRGRTWLNMAYFALRGLKWYGCPNLADVGRAEILKWVLREPSNVNENYNSKTGQPVGALYFGWSSAFVIKFVLDWDNARNDEMPMP